MADKKSDSSRLRSLRDSVKKITKRLSEGNADVIHKSDDHAREAEHHARDRAAESLAAMTAAIPPCA